MKCTKEHIFNHFTYQEPTFKYINIEAYGILFYLRDKIFRYTFWSWIEFQFLDFILDALIHRSNMSVIFLITRQIYFGVSDWIGRKITCKLYYSSQYPKPKRNYTKQWTNFYSRLLKLDKIIRSLTRNVLAVKLSLRATH